MDWTASLLHCVPVSEPSLLKEFLKSSFNHRAETYIVQSELNNYILICIFTDQLEQLHNDQSEGMILTD